MRAMRYSASRKPHRLRPEKIMSYETA